ASRRLRASRLERRIDSSGRGVNSTSRGSEITTQSPDFSKFAMRSETGRLPYQPSELMSKTWWRRDSAVERRQTTRSFFISGYLWWKKEGGTLLWRVQSSPG